MVLLPAVLLGAIAAGLGLDEGIAAGNALGYLVFFAAGAVLAADTRFRGVVRREAGLAGVVAVGLTVVAGVIFVLAGEGDPLLDRDPGALVGRAAAVLRASRAGSLLCFSATESSWTWIALVLDTAAARARRAVDVSILPVPKVASANTSRAIAIHISARQVGRREMRTAVT